jgi:hypothetical protein
MNAQPTTAFQWFSPLGISVALFMLSGGLYVLIGVLTPLLLNRGIGPTMLIVSTRPDTIVFGRSPSEMLRDDPALFQLRTILIIILGGLLFALGCFHFAITWFGLRQGQTWALVALAIGGLAVLPFWYIALRPYFEPGVNLTLFDVPPFMWVPAALLVPAVVLGWIGLSVP